MPDEPNTEDQQEDSTNKYAPNSSPLADVISLETVINVLIQKGLCTPEELFEAEQQKRQYEEQTKDVAIVQTDGSGSHAKKQRRKKQSWLKHKMSQKRWTRRLATALFGWEWKKVKHEKKQRPVQLHPEDQPKVVQRTKT